MYIIKINVELIDSLFVRNFEMHDRCTITFGAHCKCMYVLKTGTQDTTELCYYVYAFCCCCCPSVNYVFCFCLHFCHKECCVVPLVVFVVVAIIFVLS